MSIAGAFAFRYLCACRGAGRQFRRESRFKLAFLALVLGGFLLGVRLLFLEGFAFIDALGGVSVLIFNSLFSLFFLGLASMLVLSSLVTAYATLFRSDEMPYLLAAPLSGTQVAFHKLAESTLLASWAFFFVIIPFISAYMTHHRLSPLFTLWTLLFSVPLLIQCGAAGMLLAIAAARWAPRGRILVAAALAVGAAAVAAGAFSLLKGYREAPDEAAFVLARLVPGMRAASSPALPSWWMAEGLLALSRGQEARGLGFLALLTSQALVSLVLVAAAGRHLLYASWQRAAAGAAAGSRRPVLLGWLDAAARLLPPDVRALLIKDVRTFLRDPAQWSQTLIFFGLLGFYFANLRTFRYHMLPDTWRNLIAFLNVFSVSAVLCSLGARFLYPQLSLEGQGFWILGMAPTSTRRILLAKFGSSIACMLVVSVTLMTVSAAMLNVSPPVRAVSVGVAAAMAVAVSGLSAGLGAVFLDLRERNPAAIVSGFGGTLNLVLSLLFMLGAILPFAAVFHLALIGRIEPGAVRPWLLAAAAWVAALTAAAAGLPLWAGARSLAARDF